MKSFAHVEDYIEIMASYRNPVTGAAMGHHSTRPLLINVARYDSNFITSVAETVCRGDALTPRQAKLACQLILKYRRQLGYHGVDVAPVEQPQYRHPLRDMDYSCYVRLSERCLQVKFPFHPLRVDDFRKFSGDSHGLANWSREQEVWNVALTEYNVNWVCTWAQSQGGFSIDPEVQKLFDNIKKIETEPYSIQLQLTDGQLAITNAADSLREYIQENLGGFEFANLMKLVDHSSILGYTVDPTIAQALHMHLGTAHYNLMSNREIRIDPDQPDALELVLDYADANQRWPVVIFEPSQFNHGLHILERRYPAESITRLHKTAQRKNIQYTRYIHATVVVRDLEHIPLLVTTAGLLFGGDRQLMISHAEKIVYMAAGVYTKDNPNKKVRNIAS